MRSSFELGALPKGAAGAPAANVPLATTGRLRGREVPHGRGVVHLVAFVVSVPAGAVLVWLHGAADGVAVYAVALDGLYGVSAAYHLGRWRPRVRRAMGRADHAMIFIFIAATMTPYCLLAAPGTFTDVVLGLGWAGAAVSVLAVATRFEANRRVISGAYVVLGWLAIVTLPEALHHLDALQLALLGGLGGVYTLGYVVLATHWPDPSPRVFGYHEVWHSMVVVASACGFVLIWSLAGSPG